MRKLVRWLWLGFLGTSLLFLLLLGIISINLFGLFGAMPTAEMLENPKNALATEVYSDDRVMIGKFYSEFNRSPAEFKEIPIFLQNALIATEDARFYEHSGIDMKGVFAIVPSLLMGKKRGSSTLTQQLAKNLFNLRAEGEFSGPLDNTIFHKMKEWMVAIRLERQYDKKEILTMYLNTVDFGYRSYGIKTAALRYFNKPLDKLKENEIALLVGLLKGPSYYSPIRQPERALNRRNTVFGQMVKYGYLTEAKATKLEAKSLGLSITWDDDASGPAPHFRQYVKTFVRKWCKENGYSLYEDGLKVYTTIDSKMQEYAELAVSRHMKSLQGQLNAAWKGAAGAPWNDTKAGGKVEMMCKRSPRYRELKKELGDDHAAIMKEMKKKTPMLVFTSNGARDTVMSPYDSVRYNLKFLHCGFYSVDPGNGYIRAWVGDIDYRFFKYDQVRTGQHQPGSTFKPLLYAYAMEVKGLNPDSKFADTEFAYSMPGGKPWVPQNSNRKYSNTELTLREALAKSVNTISARLIQQVSPDSLVLFAKRMGITSPLEAVPSLCLGTSDVSLFDLVNAYGVFLNQGSLSRPIAVTRIEDRFGNVLADFSNPMSNQVLSEETAYYMIELLKGSVEEEGGTSVSLKNNYHINLEMGGKTGTTQNGAYGWFIGITPGLVSGGWVGGELKEVRFIKSNLGQGAKLVLPIWGMYNQAVHHDPIIAYNKKPNFDPPQSNLPQGEVKEGEKSEEQFEEVEEEEDPEEDPMQNGEFN
jgi:penicillin-binding protein 1A